MISDDGVRRRRVSIDPSELWILVQDSAAMNMSLGRLAELRKYRSRSFDRILAKTLLMYEGRSVDLFRNENHLSIVTDGSCHSCKDMLISIAYSHRIDAFAHMTGQV